MPRYKMEAKALGINHFKQLFIITSKQTVDNVVANNNYLELRTMTNART